MPAAVTRWRRLADAALAHVRRHHEWYWVPLVYAAAFAWLYRPIFFRDEHQLGFGWDTIEAYWADLAYFADRIRHGEWPIWNPFEKGGYPALAVPERGHYYPLNWLLGGYGAATGEVSWWLIQFKQWLHHVIAAGALHLFLRSRKVPVGAALIAGLGWMAGAPLVIHKASSIIWPMVWTPLIWLATDRAAQRPSWRSGAGLAAAMVLSGTAGSAPGFFYAILMSLPYGALRVVQAAIRAWRTDRRWELADLGIAFAVATVLTVVMLAVVFAPTGELTELSQRANRSAGYALSFPLPAGRTLTGLVAPLAGQFDVFLGPPILALIGAALVIAPRRDGGAPILFALAAAFFLALSFGEATPLLPWLVEHLPGFDLFRAANRYKILAALCACAAAAYGAGAIAELEPRARRALVGAIAAGAVVWIAIVVGATATRQHPVKWYPSTASMVGTWVITAWLIGALAIVPRRFAIAALIGLAVVALVDPQRYVHARDPALEPQQNNLEDLRVIAGLADLRRDYRVYDEFVLEQRAGSRLGIREFRGYPAGSSLEYRRYAAIIRRLRKHPEVLAAYNVRYVLSGRHHRVSHQAHRIPRAPDKIAPDHFRKIAPKIYEVVAPAPLAAWYGAAHVAPGEGGRVLDRVIADLATPGPRRTVVIERAGAEALGPERTAALQRAAAAPPVPVTARVTRYEASRVTTEVDAPAAGLFVLNETMYPGWQVTVDGRDERPLYVDNLLRGVWVEPGHHVVDWRFRPRGHRLRFALFWAGLVALLCAALLPRRRRRSA